MNQQPSFARRKNRGGKGLIPPNPKQWENEHNALDLREELGGPLDTPLDHVRAFALVPDIVLAAHGEMPCDQSHIEHLRSCGSWSGMAIPLPAGGAVVLFNDGHAITRVRATLMEEFFHLRLGHPLTSVRVHDAGSHRDYNGKIESEAFGSGAAALVPYQPLRHLLETGETVQALARRFLVSGELVMFRMKVTRLYHRFRPRDSSGHGS